jgi:hypothetical protein
MQFAGLAGPKCLQCGELNASLIPASVLSNANLSKANLSDADLNDANLWGATLIDSRLDGADLTGAKLWETQRGGWSIKGIICQRASWDRAGKELTEYEDGAFERIFAEKPRIVLRYPYPRGISSVELAMLPLIVERLQAEHPECRLHIRSVQDDGSGATVTITVDDRTGRQDYDFKKELVELQIQLECIQVRLECVTKERDYFQQRDEKRFQRDERLFLEAFHKIQEFTRRPTQEFHLHRPSGRVTIENIMSTGDTNINHGQAGVIGRDAHAHDNTFQQVQNQGAVDLAQRAEELDQLRIRMKREAGDTPEADEAVGAVASAQKAAAAGNSAGMLQHLKRALEIFEKIGVPVAVEAIKRAMLG